MKQCKNCGAELTDDAKFCPSCGTKVEEVSADVTSSTQADVAIPYEVEDIKDDRAQEAATSASAEQMKDDQVYQAQYNQQQQGMNQQQYSQQQYQPNQPPYEQPNPYGSYGYNPYVPKKKNGLAIAGFVVSLAGMFVVPLISGIVGLILSIMGKSKIKQTGEDGEGFAVAGIIIGIINVVVWTLAVIFFVKMMILIMENPDFYNYDFYEFY